MCTLDALLRFIAGFLMTRQKLLYLMHYYMEKQFFSWRATPKRCIFVALLHGKAGSHDAPKTLIIDALIRGKSRFSHYATENKVYIWCIISFQSRFSHGAPKTLIFDALIREKAGFLMTRPKNPWLFDALLRFKASFLITRQNVYISCFTMWKSRFSPDAPKVKMCILMYYYVVKQFSHGTPNYHYIWYIFSLKTTFYRDTRDEKRVYLNHY